MSFWNDSGTPISPTNPLTGVTGASTVVAQQTADTAQSQANDASGINSSGTNALNGQAIVSQILAQYGLQSLASGALSAYINSGDSSDYLSYWITQQPAFNAAYPAYNQLAAEGKGITLDDYQNYNQTVAQLSQAAGLPQGFITTDDITQYLLNGVSTSEVQSRFQDAAKIVNQLPAEDVNYLTREVGVSQGDLAAYWINPTNALPLIEQKLAAAQVGGAAARAGTDLNTGLANQLSQLGVSSSQAQTGFDAINQQQQLYAQLPGQSQQAISQADQVGAQFGTNPTAGAQVAANAAQQRAQFASGGSFANSSTGYTGVGTANNV